MRIDVTTGASDFDDQTRAYAEFRVFSRLARFSDVVAHASVSLKRRPCGLESVTCVVGVTLTCGTRTRIGGRGEHACEAIDRAAERVGDVLRRHARR